MTTLQETERDIAAIGDRIDLMRAALEACAAWHWAEREGRKHGFTFEDCMELCKYSEDMTLRALGVPCEGEYKGVPRIMVYPGLDVRLVCKTADETKAIVDRIVAFWRTKPVHSC